jgi:hypothetical protein
MFGFDGCGATTLTAPVTGNPGMPETLAPLIGPGPWDTQSGSAEAKATAPAKGVAGAGALNVVPVSAACWIMTCEKDSVPIVSVVVLRVSAWVVCATSVFVPVPPSMVTVPA